PSGPPQSSRTAASRSHCDESPVPIGFRAGSVERRNHDPALLSSLVRFHCRIVMAVEESGPWHSIREVWLHPDRAMFNMHMACLSPKAPSLHDSMGSTSWLLTWDPWSRR